MVNLKWQKVAWWTSWWTF